MTTAPAGPLVQLAERIRTALGPGGTLESPADVEKYLTDFRGLYHGAALLVACPHDTAQVARLLALCHEARVGVVPHGGNTGYCGGATPSATGDQVVLSLHRMNRVRAVDAANYSMVVEAGCVLADVQAAARAAGRYFPLSLGSEGSCQVGGNLSTNAGGLAAVRYGVARDLVLGLEVVLASGDVIHGLSSLRKDNTGYDLRDLFIGAEGTLGIITAASLKLFPPPRTVETAFLAVPGMHAAVAVLARLREATGDCVTSFEYLPRIAVDFTTRHVPGVSDPLGGPWPAYVLCEVSTARDDPQLRALLEAALHACMEDGDVLDATLAESLAQRESLWRLRESVPEAQKHEGASIKHDVAVPVAALPEFLERASAAVARVAPSARLVAYGHVGDGNLHFNLSEPAGGGDRASFLALQDAINDAVHDCVRDFGGSISAEHGIGRLKRDLLARYKDPAALATMRAIKRALDPSGILNPGKLLPD
ncbi:MAG TPA: FAD-binding oxidoreductase [Steroidobacteraceae bacterium]|nr:FAD-binding oxidoreductase [Steroidobacteraceae bacterium]